MKFELRHIIPILILATILTLTGCTDAPLPADTPADAPARPLSFTGNAATITPAARSLNYDGLHTTFTDGTLIGCVIAFKDDTDPSGYAYQANSCWTWHPAGLTLTKLYDADNQPIDINSAANTLIRHMTAAEIDEHVEADPNYPANKDYLLKLLTPDKDYAFFFYYPYVDEEVIDKAITKANGKADEFPYLIANKYGAPSKTNYIAPIVGKEAVAKSNSNDAVNDPLYASWTEFPVIPQDNFTKGAENERLELSDFMHAIVNKSANGLAINSTNAKNIGQIPVVLQKKMVTIDLLFYENPTNLYIEAIKSQQIGWALGMKRAYKFNLSTGQFLDEDYEFSEWAQSIKKFAKYSYSKDNGDNNACEPITPAYIGEETETVKDAATGDVKDIKVYKYRVVVSPQKRGSLFYKLSFSIADKTLTLNDIERNPLLAELKSGYYYRIRFSNTSGTDTGWHLLIEDWNSGGSQTLTRPD